MDFIKKDRKYKNSSMNDFEKFLEKYQEIGYVDSFFYGTCSVVGLPNVKEEEIVLTEGGSKGLVVGLKEEKVEVLILEEREIKVGEKVVRTGSEFLISISEDVLGRIINPLGYPIDGKGVIKRESLIKVNVSAPSFVERKKINENLETGVMLVDLLVPIGYGQRELIIGDAKSGKTSFLLQIMNNQAKKGVFCIYVGIGKKDIAIRQVEEYLKKEKVIDKVVIIHSPPDDSPSLLYLAPFSGMAIAEYFREKYKKAIVIFDDLSTHAKIYRQISLSLKRAPGRDLYPGDIFHLHASLMERAGNLKDGKSITAFPVAETFEGDLSGYIQTNLMGMTDGHIFFDIEEFRKGKRPAINHFLSVSRVGIQTKTRIEKEIANWLREKLYYLGQISEIIPLAGELPQKTQEFIELARKIEIILQQNTDELIGREGQVILFGLLISGFFDDKTEEKIKREKEIFFKKWNEKKIPSLREEISRIKNIEHLKFLIEEIKPKIEEILKENAND
jgi:F-type H+-transporting ATPase subunit alpha